MTIIPEQPQHAQAIFEITLNAFKTTSYADGNEQFIPGALRERGEMELSLVKLDADQAVIGHVAISPVRVGVEEEGWFGVGPLSVRPDHHGEGVGSQLMIAAIDEMKSRGVRGLVLLGSSNYYPRFGFVGDGCVTYRGEPAEVTMYLLFNGPEPKGEITFSDAFEAKS